MEAKAAEKSSDEVKAEILNAAESRFRTYGYNKTTMAEIARDVNMSAANLYRYFENKQDIAAACAQQCFNDQMTRLREVVRLSNIGAAEKLERFVLEMLRYTWETAEQQPKLNELVEFIVNERSELVHAKIKASSSLLAEVLAQGNASGEFEVDDVLKTAETVHAALKMFHVPIFMSLFEYEALEQRARDVVTLLIKGLSRR